MDYQHLFEIESNSVDDVLKQMHLTADLLQGKVAIVTGSARGIGEQTARGLAYLGAAVVIADVRDEGAQVAREIEAAGGKAIFVKGDLADEENVYQAHHIAVTNYGPVDIVVNNAVHFDIYSIMEMSVRDWDRSMQTNLRAAFLFARLVLPEMLERRSGVILNMIAAEGMAYAADMSASKVGLRSLTMSLAAELGENSGVSVLGFAPGLVATPLVEDVFPRYAKRVGIDFEEYVLGMEHNPGYKGLMPPTHAAAGVVQAIVDADDFHGLIADPYGPLSEAAIISIPPLDARSTAVEKVDGQDNSSRLYKHITEVTQLNKRIEEKIRKRTRELREEQALTRELLHQVEKHSSALEASNERLKAEIAERELMQSALQEAKEAAEHATRAKSSFLANMSHEIRTPLNAIIGLTELMMDAPLSPEHRDFMGIIRNSGDGLLTIINDILDFSKIEAGKLELEEKAFSLRQLVGESLDMIALKAAQKGVEILFSIDEQVPRQILSDATRLRQILVNLLSNAVKFTEEGEIVVRGKLVGETESGSLIQISVCDSGIGIPKDRMHRLFQPFSQVDASTTRKYGGTGLGLVISQRLCAAMEGDMWVESEPQRGTQFHFTFLAEAANSSFEKPFQSNRTSLQQKSLLIVDDNESNLAILDQEATNWGMVTTATGSGALALNLLAKGTDFDCLLIDEDMPNIDGLMVAAKARQLGYDQTPIALMVTRSTKSGRSSHEKVRIDRRVSKPIKPDELCQIISELCWPKDKNELIGQAKLRKAPPTLSTQSIQRILLVEDNLVNQKVALRMLHRLGFVAEVANNGQEAVSLCAREQYQIVFMDVQMPVMDGVTATKQITENMAANEAPYIVAMTANALKGDREKYLLSGMDDYISKPVRLAELEATIKRASEYFALQK